MRIYTGSDHAGFRLKETLKGHLRARDHEVIDLGADSEMPTDYPDYAAPVARKVRDEPGSLGFLVCGSGAGVCITANKVVGIRAVTPASVEAAQLSRQHNDANVLCLGQRFIDEKTAVDILDAFLSTRFEGGRHVPRLQKIRAIEAAEAAASGDKAPGDKTVR